MNINYQLTLNEYQEAVTHHYKTSKRPLLVSFFIGLTTFMILVGTDFNSMRDVITKMFMVFFTISFYILFTRMITAHQAKKIYNKTPLLSNEVTLHISGKGINPDKSANNALIPWKKFSHYKQSDKYYLIYSNKHQFSVLPKRVLNQAQEKELNEYLKKYLTPNVK